MSVYTSFPLPVVTYSILHRPVPGISREQYEGTIVEMHRRVEEESALFGEQHAKLLSDLSGRQAQMLRGPLSQFLETPIRSDNAEVLRIFQEAFNEHRGQLSEGGPYGAAVSWAGFAVPPASGPAWLRKLEANGRRSRRVLGLDPPRGGPGVYESVYVVRGGVNLDVLEHIVRDRLGIYASAHGKHIGESAPFVVAAHNLVHASGADFWKSLSSSWGKQFSSLTSLQCRMTSSGLHSPHSSTELSPLRESLLQRSGSASWGSDGGVSLRFAFSFHGAKMCRA